MSSQSLDVSAPSFVRARLARALKARGYRVLDAARVDAALKSLGISEGGQLAAYAPVRLGKAVGAELLCYGEILDYAFKSAVVLSQRRVEFRLRLVDAKTGEVLWEGVAFDAHTTGGTEAVGELAVDTAGKVVKGVKDGTKMLLPGKTLKDAADATDFVADVELRRETDRAIEKLIRSLESEMRAARSFAP